MSLTTYSISYEEIKRKAVLRTCKTMHHCELCDNIISIGQRYYDRGYGHRIHKTCLDEKLSNIARAKIAKTIEVSDIKVEDDGVSIIIEGALEDTVIKVPTDCINKLIKDLQINRGD